MPKTVNDKLDQLTEMIKARDFMTSSVEDYISDELSANPSKTRDEAIDALITRIKTRIVR